MGVLPAVLLISTWSICADFNNIGSSPPDLQDWNMLHLGCDYGHDIAWSPSEVLYLVGTTGGHALYRECPYPFPGPSYCELISTPLNPIADATDGMIARFDMSGLSIGLAEGTAAAGGLLVYPSPTSHQITIHNQVPGLATFSIFDATGRVVRTVGGRGTFTLDVGDLSSGIYAVQGVGAGPGMFQVGRFIRE